MEAQPFLWNLKEVSKCFKDIAIILLNTAITKNAQEFLVQVWNKASLNVVADGGLNHLHSLNLTKEVDELIPHIISGDFDSVKTSLLDLYAKKGSKVISTPSQDETDFTKALKITLANLKENNKRVDAIFGLVSLSGRLDHVMGNFQTLYLALDLTNIPVVLYDGTNLCWVLQKGTHEMNVDPKYLTRKVGLIPLGRPCTNITTTGLKWNLNNHVLKFGTLVSTSNSFDGSDKVTISTQEPILWTVEAFLE